MSPSPAGHAAGNRVVTQDFDGTWEQLQSLPLPPSSALAARHHLDAVRAVRTAADGAHELLVAGRSRLTADLRDELRAEGLAVVDVVDVGGSADTGDAADVGDTTGGPVEVTSPTTDREPVPGRVWLLTSGSTGRPKRVAHTLDSLTTVGGDQPPRTWLCPYAHGAYAWWQVVTLGLRHPGQDILFVEPDELDTWPARALEVGVTAASGTPTFWRQALYRDPDAVAALPLEQVTLGGEPVDQAILTRLTELFPAARVSWIYASSEAGASIAVHDGLAGFPAAWLGRQQEGRARLDVVDGELVIASPRRGAGVDDVLRTGDRAEVVDGRVLLPGRVASDEINVGGAKASAAQVRAVLLDHPRVAWAAVRGRRAPIVGSIVTADVVPVRTDGPGTDPLTEADLSAWCTDRLPDHAVPRRVRFLDQIPIKESLKSDV
ncbi:AMP-binding protein [Terracoccus luteus]|uniref:Acyl-CoA synthetase (AMP-forming)/AMP-acid ligase II n=1 Tax=Terracoccus luteus TaxID=53356 RepID=A0A839PYH7_9MICO|nr:AMP-binding protein [Terracoccus luteus]MBB2985451.1 acyl-CoA synthetase (AMP-forming)/AMP-acid ligase II [Terracoccus luteus]MCP2171103.1 acyl-CoA synthetase (AMP-forming)/AMP-acid ligase II [Terracoccus luteus]